MVSQSLCASNTEGTSLSNFQLLLGMSKYLAALKSIPSTISISYLILFLIKIYLNDRCIL